MARRSDVNKINLTIDNVDFWSGYEYSNKGIDTTGNSGNKGGMRIYWSADIGFGTLDIVKRSGNDGEDCNSPVEKLMLESHTECMDRGDDKEFTTKLMSLLAEYVIIID